MKWMAKVSVVAALMLAAGSAFGQRAQPFEWPTFPWQQRSFGEQPRTVQPQRVQPDDLRAWQQQRGTQTVTGRVLQVRSVDLRRQGRRTGQQSVVAIVETTDGQQIAVDLGPARELRDVRVRRGSRIIAAGAVTRIGDRPVLMAERARIDGEATQIERPFGAQQTQTATGRVERVKQVRVRGTRTTHVVVLLQTREGRRLAVDLGPSDQLRRVDIRSGTRLQVSGQPTRVGDRLVLFADRVSVDGRRIRIDRQTGF